MIVIRCLNGYVLFRVSARQRERDRMMRCLEDGQVFTVPTGPDSAVLGGLSAALSHAVALHGAVQWIADIGLD